jgi:hypothetical protein
MLITQSSLIKDRQVKVIFTLLTRIDFKMTILCRQNDGNQLQLDTSVHTKIAKNPTLNLAVLQTI